MANRTWPNEPRTQGVEHVHMPIVVQPQGSSAPTIGEGDPKNSYFTITRNSAGNMTLTTVDTFLGVVTVGPQATSGYRVQIGTPTQNANKTWSIPIYTATDSSAVASVTMTNNGAGYASTPAVSFTGGGGTGAAGVAVMSSNTVASVTITNGGFGYTSAPTVVFTGGSPSTNAAGTAVLATGASADIPAGNPVYLDLIFRNSSVQP